MYRKKRKFSIRKFSTGVASSLLGITILFGTGVNAQAEQTKENSKKLTPEILLEQNNNGKGNSKDGITKNKKIKQSSEIKNKNSMDVLKSDTMTIKVDENFPTIKEYILKDGTKVNGQTYQNNEVIVNGELLPAKTTYKKINNSKSEYRLDVKNESGSIDATFIFNLAVMQNNIELQMTDYINHSNDPENYIRSFGFYDHALVSVNEGEKDATLKLTKMSTNTMKSGDKEYKVDKSFNSEFLDYGMYGFISNDHYSAGLWSNAQVGNSGEQDFLRVSAIAHDDGKVKSVGLTAAPWIIQPTLQHKSAKEQGLLPHVKVAIAQDENADNKIDWQDGAIRYRDIMNNPYKFEEVPDLVGYRIAMNFGSQAQNPFLKTLDGVKKFSLNTDGLGQSILLKGYGSEGHDSGHLDYANVGQRMGGKEDLNTLLSKGASYGAKFGVHINASETYPESKVFNPDLLRKNSDGSYSYGWNWLDQGFNIDADYDLTHGRAERFKKFKEVVGDKLDFIYVDVWGNNQSGNNQAWASHQLAKEITDLGWRVGVEWGHGMEYDSTFQHWAADLTYGGYQYKGINSEVARFIRNHQKDSWVGNYPQYSGAADFPLLGGYDMKDFEGWQGRNDYPNYIKNIFKTNVPTKFLQHYKVMRIENGQPVKMTANGQTINWTPEMLVELQNENKDKVIVERKSNDYENDIKNYRSRTMTLNNKVILDGEKYLLPWYWDQNGKLLPVKDSKLYHYSVEGGTSSWELPNNWSSKKAFVYKLTDTGKELVDQLDLKNNTITLKDIESETPYVIYGSKQKEEKMVWSEGTLIDDTGFNSERIDQWKVRGDKGSISIAESVSGNEMLKIQDSKVDTSLTQKIKGLVPGQQYALYVGVDNRSENKASISVSKGNKIISSTSTSQSIAKNYVKADAHNTSKESETKKNQGSYFQNMYVYFVAPQSGNIDLTIHREKGEGETYFDDLRIVKNDSKLMNNSEFNQDFEKVPQGLFPFVVSEAEGVEDNRVHLSEKNAPYTQRGWNNKRLNDVIGGDWSLKVNGLTGKNKMVIQTIPQNYYFKPGVTYEVSFDYESGSDGTYAFATGNGSIDVNKDFKKIPLNNTIDESKPKRITFNVTGGENGDTWIGIYSTNKAPDLRNVKNNNQINFEGMKDFVIDNLTIKPVNEDK
ncbi:YSIRK-type signal peptide-containing protein [Macrococcoides goetzii]|uniref:YSIRK-type signal peptide-containing protein n=1 Tax=Macrococcoides goetzii TaxID=1891097 RepID=A0A395G979_9STAP|nr:endo-alpha-N-acetylgalactosaminidase family protein [Macrococcus goetzii]RAI80532.1 YSIRK-type signal peptide-containing protein [Macrococcus goetzii]